MTRDGLISYVRSRVEIRRLDEPTIQRVLLDFNLENLEAIPENQNLGPLTAAFQAADRHDQ